MPNTTKKTSTKNSDAKSKDAKTCERLSVIGVLMSLASVLMALLPMMYSGVYRYLSWHVDTPINTLDTTTMIISGFVVALLYFLLGLYIIRASENNTRLSRGVYHLSLGVVLLAVLAALFLFLPWPVPTFHLFMEHFASAEYIQPGIIPMFIMIYVDMALIIGLTAATSHITRTCIVKPKHKE